MEQVAVAVGRAHADGGHGLARGDFLFQAFGLYRKVQQLHLLLLRQHAFFVLVNGFGGRDLVQQVGEKQAVEVFEADT